MMITRESLAELMRDYARRYGRSPNECRLNDKHLQEILTFARLDWTGGDADKLVKIPVRGTPVMGMQFTVVPEAKRISVRFNKRIKNG